MENIIVPCIFGVVYAILFAAKRIFASDKFDRFIPLVAIALGSLLGGIAFFASPEIISATNLFSAIIIGAVSGWATTGANQTLKQLSKIEKDEKKDGEKND